MKNDGTKFDAGKIRFDLLPPTAMEEFGRVLSFGAKQYGANNWRQVKGWRWRYIGAAIRHLMRYLMGEREDKQTGLQHLAHVLCCVSFVLDLDLLKAEHGDDQDAEQKPDPRVAPHDVSAVVKPAPFPGDVCAKCKHHNLDHEFNGRCTRSCSCDLFVAPSQRT